MSTWSPRNQTSAIRRHLQANGVDLSAVKVRSQTIDCGRMVHSFIFAPNPSEVVAGLRNFAGTVHADEDFVSVACPSRT